MATQGAVDLVVNAPHQLTPRNQINDIEEGNQLSPVSPASEDPSGSLTGVSVAQSKLVLVPVVPDPVHLQNAHVLDQTQNDEAIAAKLNSADVDKDPDHPPVYHNGNNTNINPNVNPNGSNSSSNAQNTHCCCEEDACKIICILSSGLVVVWAVFNLIEAEDSLTHGYLMFFIILTIVMSIGLTFTLLCSGVLTALLNIDCHDHLDFLDNCPFMYNCWRMYDCQVKCIILEFA